MHFDYMKPRQNRSGLKLIRMPAGFKAPMFVGSLTSGPRIDTAIKAGTLAELVIAGKIGAQHVLMAIQNGTVKAGHFKAVFWKEVRGVNIERLPQAALNTIGLLIPVLM